MQHSAITSKSIFIEIKNPHSSEGFFMGQTWFEYPSLYNFTVMAPIASLKNQIAQVTEQHKARHGQMPAKQLWQDVAIN